MTTRESGASPQLRLRRKSHLTPAQAKQGRTPQKPTNSAFDDKRTVDKRGPARRARGVSTSIMSTAGPAALRDAEDEQGCVTKIEADGIPSLIEIDAPHVTM
jgi:hypothetical protein